MSVIKTASTKILLDCSKSDTNNNSINGKTSEFGGGEEGEEEEEEEEEEVAATAEMANCFGGDDDEDCVITNNNSKECCDECDINGHRNTAQQTHVQTNREQLRKQFVDVFRLATTPQTIGSNSTPSISSMSSSSSRMSSPSPSCETPTQPPHSPSTLTSIRDAVSHLTRLDDFNVIKLSQGFFSQVFKVTHHSTKKVMVLKMNKQAGNRGNALKEIELLNKLNHENIVAFMGTVVHEGALHPLLEYINGGTLEKLILQYYNLDDINDSEPQQPMMITNVCNSNNGFVSQTQTQYRNYKLNDPTPTFVNLATDIARGMDYLHSLHYLHRDLTSKNVLIRKRMPIDDNEPQLSAVIGDFGFAAVEPTADQKLPTVGSPYWLAPECIKGQWYNHKCDIFSFGVICCELNWRIPADPDYLPRNDNFTIVFDKLLPPKDTPLARVAQLACQKNPCVRPEFSEILDIFESQVRYSSQNDCICRRETNQCYNNVFEGTQEVNNGCGDIFDQHLIRRRNSQIEKQKLFNGG